MYNPQLETFLRVADTGSFNKAAEQNYITPTAVIKQINLLFCAQSRLQSLSLSGTSLELYINLNTSIFFILTDSLSLIHI